MLPYSFVLSVAEHDVTIESLLLRIFRKFLQLNTEQFVIHVVLSVVQFLEANTGAFLMEFIPLHV